MTHKKTFVVFAILIAIAFMTGAGTAAGQSAPDCSTVSYNGSGTDADPYEVGNVDQLQCIDNQSGLLDSNYVQVADIDASGTSAWNGGKGFEPIGEYNRTADTEFLGSFDGADHTILGLTIARGGADNIGLFAGLSSGARLENVSLVNVNVTGSLGLAGDPAENVGALVGTNEQPGGPASFGTVTDSYATGNVSGGQRVGGLVGFNEGVVRDSYATVFVSGEADLGGLVGTVGPEAVVNNSYAIGDVGVRGRPYYAGGLVGANSGLVTESYATGNISGTTEIGGLVGRNSDIVERSYATGNVSANRVVGGLVGQNGLADAVVRDSYATGSVAGGSKVGGLAGLNSDSLVESSYATGDVTGSGDNVSGLVGKNSTSDDEFGNITESYWDTETTGQPNSEGGTGLNTSEMIGSAVTSNMTGFDFTSTWETVTNPDDYPILTWQTQADPAPAKFEVYISSTNSPVTEGDTVRVTATITNTGVKQSTQNITSSAPGLVSLKGQVTLDGGESRTDIVPIPTSSGDNGSYTVNVSSEDDFALEAVEVTQQNRGNFTDPLPGFKRPPQNLQSDEGGFNDSLIEDLDGDGNPTDIAPTVSVFGELIRGNDLGLTDAQAKKLNWNEDSPAAEVTVADMVTLFGKQIRAD
jgi:hypothetical protein